MDDKLYARVSFQNLLMEFFNKYYSLAQFAMTTASIKTRDDYSDIKSTLRDFSAYAKELIELIPPDEDGDFKSDTREFLELISDRLNNIAERYMHLESKMFDGEQYSFFDDRVYIKNDRRFEKEISNLGVKMNRYKEETKRMLELS